MANTADSPEELKWWYVDGSVTRGPISSSVLASLLAAKAIPADTMVFSEGMADWQPLSSVPQFAHVTDKLVKSKATKKSRKLNIVLATGLIALVAIGVVLAEHHSSPATKTTKQDPPTLSLAQKAPPPPDSPQIAEKQSPQITAPEPTKTSPSPTELAQRELQERNAKAMEAFSFVSNHWTIRRAPLSFDVNSGQITLPGLNRYETITTLLSDLDASYVTYTPDVDYPSWYHVDIPTIDNNQELVVSSLGLRYVGIRIGPLENRDEARRVSNAFHDLCLLYGGIDKAPESWPSAQDALAYLVAKSNKTGNPWKLTYNPSGCVVALKNGNTTYSFDLRDIDPTKTKSEKVYRFVHLTITCKPRKGIKRTFMNQELLTPELSMAFYPNDVSRAKKALQSACENVGWKPEAY